MIDSRESSENNLANRRLVIEKDKFNYQSQIEEINHNVDEVCIPLYNDDPLTNVKLKELMIIALQNEKVLIKLIEDPSFSYKYKEDEDFLKAYVVKGISDLRKAQKIIQSNLEIRETDPEKQKMTVIEPAYFKNIFQETKATCISDLASDIFKELLDFKIDIDFPLNGKSEIYSTHKIIEDNILGFDEEIQMFILNGLLEKISQRKEIIYHYTEFDDFNRDITSDLINWIFKRITQLKLKSQFEVDRLPGTERESRKNDKIEKTFVDYFIIQYRKSLPEKIRNEFKTETGINIRLLIDVLKDQKIITVEHRGNASFYKSLKTYFNRKIGSYQSIFDYKRNNDEFDYYAIEMRIKSLIES